MHQLIEPYFALFCVKSSRYCFVHACAKKGTSRGALRSGGAVRAVEGGDRDGAEGSMRQIPPLPPYDKAGAEATRGDG